VPGGSRVGRFVCACVPAGLYVGAALAAMKASRGVRWGVGCRRFSCRYRPTVACIRGPSPHLHGPPPRTAPRAAPHEPAPPMAPPLPPDRCRRHATAPLSAQRAGPGRGVLQCCCMLVFDVGVCAACGRRCGPAHLRPQARGRTPRRRLLIAVLHAMCSQHLRELRVLHVTGGGMDGGAPARSCRCCRRLRFSPAPLPTLLRSSRHRAGAVRRRRRPALRPLPPAPVS
jgi:hypothetical protein